MNRPRFTPGNVLSALALVVTLLTALQGATFSYVVKTEARLTRLETILDRERIARERLQPPGGLTQMKGIVDFGFDVSAAAYQGGDGKLLTVPPVPVVAVHDFQADAQGCLLHSIDGKHRATVPPEGLADYARLWPACAPIVAELRAADHGTPGAAQGGNQGDDYGY